MGSGGGARYRGDGDEGIRFLGGRLEEVCISSPGWIC